MKKILILSGRELKTFFDSLIAYILLGGFLAITGVITWVLPFFDVFTIGSASMEAFFETAYWTLFFFIPAITMSMLAEENRSGTIELLLTKAVSDWQVVVGKFLAVMSLILFALLFSLPYYFSISRLGDVDHGVVWCGYLALILMSAAYSAIGLWASSITKNQIIAFLLAILFGILFHGIFWVLGQVDSPLSNFFFYLSDRTHFNSLIKGVVDSSDLIYFISISIIGLVLTEGQLSKRHQA